jgi:hypothetical protein
MRGGFARAPSGGDLLTITIVGSLSEPGLSRKVPGLFVFVRPAGGTGIRACLRSMSFRVRIPGGVPDFVLRWRKNRRTLFYNLDVARSPAARIEPAFTCGPRGGAAGLVVLCRHSSTGRARIGDRLRFRNRCQTLISDEQGSRRLTVRTAAFQAANAGSIPAGNTSIHLAVAKPEARLVRDEEAAGSNPARETNNSPVAQWKQERAVTTREAEGSNPSWGGASSTGGRGLKSRRCRQYTARNSMARVADS